MKPDETQTIGDVFVVAGDVFVVAGVEKIN